MIIKKKEVTHLCVKMERYKRIDFKNKASRNGLQRPGQAAGLSENRTAAEGHSPNNWVQMTPVPLALSANDRLIARVPALDRNLISN